jgi:hypothetical protein
MSDLAAMFARSQAVVALAGRQAHLRRVALGAETMGNHAALAAATAEMDLIDCAMDAASARPAPDIDLDLLDGDPVAFLDAAIADLEQE